MMKADAGAIALTIIVLYALYLGMRAFLNVRAR